MPADKIPNGLFAFFPDFLVVIWHFVHLNFGILSGSSQDDLAFCPNHEIQFNYHHISLLPDVSDRGLGPVNFLLPNDKKKSPEKSQQII